MSVHLDQRVKCDEGIRNTPEAKSCRKVIEFVGPAGAGKSSVIQQLTGTDNRFQEVQLPNSLQCLAQLPNVASTTFLSGAFGKPAFGWSQVRSMLYLEAWSEILKKENETPVQIFDHGPAFRLASLKAFSPHVMTKALFRRWWEKNLTQWSQSLDKVIWLDAPDSILLDRIQKREQQHACQSMGSSKAYDFLNRSRNALEQVLDQIQMTGIVSVIRFDTDQLSTEEIVDRVNQIIISS